MSLVINNNIASLNAQNNLALTTNELSSSLEKLSSGLKINRGADDPAGLVISEQQRAQISGLQTAIDNTSKAVTVVQTAEGALNEINSLLVQIRSVALDAANNGIQDTNSLAADQAQIANALATIDRIAANTQFGTKKLLDGSAGITGSSSNTAVTFLKANSTSPTGAFTLDITTAGARATTTAATVQTGALAANETLTINGVAIALTAGETQAQVRDTINQFSGQTGVTADLNGTGGATRLYTTAFGSNAKISVQSNVAAAATSSGFGTALTSVTGTDIAGDFGGASFTASGNGNVLTGSTGSGAAGISVSVGLASGSQTTTASGSALATITVTDNSLVFQIGPNANQTAKVSVDNVATQALGLNVVGDQFSNLNQIDVRSSSGANDAVKVIDQAVNDVSTLRGRLGAFQSQTLESTANTLRTTLENTTAAESVIRDTDFAAETANFTKFQVLAQAGTSVLTQANQTSQLVLALLQKL
jgi:flagellin